MITNEGIVKERRKFGKCCRTCNLWSRKGAVTATGRVSTDAGVRCLWVPTEPMPASIVSGHSAVVGFMTSTEGKDCHCWLPVKPKLEPNGF